MPSDRDPERERLERLNELSAKMAAPGSPPTGAIRCSLCGGGILKVADVVKVGLASKVAVAHQRCYQALSGGRAKAPARRPKSRGRRG